jgi:uncharacterized protein YbgA (DUF1722 family)/uncharacterized protein YbbK (DUF523 family)
MGLYSPGALMPDSNRNRNRDNGGNRDDDGEDRDEDGDEDGDGDGGDRNDDGIVIGVSACLLGSEVRFDGQHKRDAFLVDELGAFVRWVPVCPEVEVGMGVPRESVRLVADPRPQGRLRMLGNRTGEDWTDRMTALAERRVRALGPLRLSGYVLKSRSPSCGMERVKVFPRDDDGDDDEGRAGAQPSRDGVGLFAAELLRQMPNLPVEEEGRLADPRLRENFIERVFAYHRLRRLWQERWTVGRLVAFHTAHKMALLAHSTDGYRRLGRLVGEAKKQPRAALREQYEGAFMAVLKKPATPGRHANVLTHMLGHLRGHLDAADRDELRALIEDHRRGLVPLVVPLVLMRHHVKKHAIAYLLGQSYLDPHPKELMLRNRV